MTEDMEQRILILPPSSYVTNLFLYLQDRENNSSFQQRFISNI